MSAQRRRAVTDRDISDLLQNSDIEDFDPSDEDLGDPEYVVQDRQLAVSDSDSIDSDQSHETASETEYLDDYLQESASSRRGAARNRGRGTLGRGRGRGRAQARGRGQSVGRSRGQSRGRGSGRGRGRGRACEIGSHQDSEVENGQDINQAAASPNWSNKDFPPNVPTITLPAYLNTDTEGYEKIDYFKQYVEDDFFEMIAINSNRTAVKLTGKSLDITSSEVKIYVGASMIMASINYPSIRMYWQKRWRVPVIADNMARNRFLQIRNSLKLVYDDDISYEEKAKDRLWRVRPLIDSIQQGCLLQEKSHSMSVDEMMIPFTGACPMKQYCPGKPHPTGLKAFVLANPNGKVCDFHIYQGETTYPEYNDTPFGLADKAVLSLADKLVPGHVLYFDRYFSSQRLADELLKRNIGCTGTLMKNRIPRDCLLKDDRELKSEGRGSFHVMVRKDDKLAVTKWLDSKTVSLMSTVEAGEEIDFCERWCKKERRYLSVTRPRVVREYNRNMGGVDLADRLLSVCPNRYKTKKWTVRMFSHMIDLAVSNAWLQYKADLRKKGTPSKKIDLLRSYKLDLGETLIQDCLQSDTQDTVSNESDEENQDVVVNVPRKRGRESTNPIPSKKQRTHAAKHMPELNAKQNRCRQCHYNKTYFKCTSCQIYLCLTKNRNCYAEFHQD